jgi:transcriptional regulator with XRE-family HTH domain
MGDTAKPDDWRARVQSARKRLGLTQDEVAERAGLSKETVRAYEGGRRLPVERAGFVRLLEALEVSRIEANAILDELGFAPIREYPIPVDRAVWYGLDQVQALVDACPWPSFAVNDLIEVVSANAAFEALFGVDIASEFPDPSMRSLLALATTPRFADRIANWDEAVGVVVAVWKGHFTREVSLDDPTPQLSKILDSVAGGDPTYLRRILTLWTDGKTLPAARRWFYPIVWRDDELGLVHFQAIVQAGDDPETMISFNDWIPTDAATWSALGVMIARAGDGSG